MLGVVDLTCFHGQFPVVTQASFSIEPGAIMVIHGHNGAGKTTLLDSIMGRHRHRTGQVFFKGKNVTRLATHAIVQKGVRYHPQSWTIFPDLTVDDHLRLSNDHDDKKTDMWALFPNLDARRDHPARVLSGGECQMLGLACALIAQPSVLILDEPLAGLTDDMRNRCLDLIRSYKERHNAAVLLVEQDVSKCAAIADCTAILENGVLSVVS